MKISRRKLIVLGGGALASSALSMPAIASGKKIKVGALRFTSHSASFIAKNVDILNKQDLMSSLSFSKQPSLWQSLLHQEILTMQ